MATATAREIENEIADNEIADIERQLDEEEAIRVLASVGLDERLKPVTPQYPDWMHMCQRMNNEEVDERAF